MGAGPAGDNRRPPLGVFALWAWITLSYTYSRGDRAGYVQKISKKGWICRTWEGELAMNPHYMSMNLLAHDKVLYDGHPVAAVAATSPHIAEEAIRLIKVDYEVLPHLVREDDLAKAGPRAKPAGEQVTGDDHHIANPTSEKIFNSL